MGLPAGNQALAVLSSNGTVLPLTFNSSDIGTSDGCPRFIAGTNGSQLLFVRELEDGAVRRMAHLDRPSGKVTLLPGPLLDGWGGCTVARGHQFGYIAEEHSEMEVVTVQSLNPFHANISTAFPIPRVNTSGSVGALSLQFCSHLSSQDVGHVDGSIACKNANLKGWAEHVALVNAKTGQHEVNLTVPRPSWVPADAAYNWQLTPNSFHVWRNHVRKD